MKRVIRKSDAKKLSKSDVIPQSDSKRDAKTKMRYKNVNDNHYNHNIHNKHYIHYKHYNPFNHYNHKNHNNH